VAGSGTWQQQPIPPQAGPPQGTGAWQSAGPQASGVWQQPGGVPYAAEMPPGGPGGRPGGGRGLMYGLIGGGAAVLVAALVIGLIVALSHNSNNSKPLSLGTTRPPSPTSTFNQADECNKVIDPLGQQMTNISNELNGNPSDVVTLVNQEANLYNQAAQSAAGDPQLQQDLSNIATDLSNLGDDVTNQDSASAQVDLTQLETDVRAAEQLCGLSG
jgi:hypothetical protein